VTKIEKKNKKNKKQI